MISELYFHGLHFEATPTLCKNVGTCYTSGTLWTVEVVLLLKFKIQQSNLGILKKSNLFLYFKLRESVWFDI